MKLYESINHNRREYFKTATPKEKFKYLADYYGFRTIIFLIIMIAVISAIVSSCNRPESILSGTFINIPHLSQSDATSKISEDFLKSENIDSKKYTTAFSEHLTYYQNDTSTGSYESKMVLNTYMAAGELDFIVASPDLLLELAYGDSFVDLTTVLSSKQVEKYKPYFLYIDMDVVAQLQEISLTDEQRKDIVIPDFKKPEEMKNPVPVAIDFSHVEQIKDLYHSQKIDLGFAIVLTGKNIENTVKFLDFITK